MGINPAESARWLIDQHFVGAAFQDTLFNTDNELRERACSWKIMSSMRYFSPLASGTWRWKAIGIPLNLLDRSLQGDIDVLIAMLPAPIMQNGKHAFPPPVYRCFELKTAKITRSGDVKSLKTGKFHKVIGQLEKLCNLGSQQVFLLETFIVEAGYSNKGLFGMPPLVREAVSNKYNQIMQADYGYVAMAIEQLPGFDVNATGVAWPTQTIKSAKTRDPTGPILDIIHTVDAYVNASAANRAVDVITYCYACQKLTHTHRTGPYSCRDCKTSFI